MSKFIKNIGLLNTTFDYARGIKICANSGISYIKPESKGRSLALRRSTKRHK